MSNVLIVSCDMGTLLGSSSALILFAASSVMMPAFATVAVSLLATLFRLRLAARAIFSINILNTSI